MVAVIGDGALTGGMCWEALNNIAARRPPGRHRRQRQRPVLLADHRRRWPSTSPACGCARATSGCWARCKDALGRTPVVGPPLYDALHGMKRGIKDLLAPQGMFEDLGLKYVGPVDGHDIAALENALRWPGASAARCVVHCVTRKGFGYPPAENDEADHMHQSRRRSTPRPGGR